MRLLVLVACALFVAAAARADEPTLFPVRLQAEPCMAVSSGADFRCALDGDGRFRRAPSPLWPAPRTYVAYHSARVERDMLVFEHSYTLEHMRERDRLLLYNPPRGGDGAALLGAGLFSVAVVSAAHAPRPLRVLFDRRLHFGPAVFDGGMGAAFGGDL